MTSTSEISGKASRGMRRSPQMPASTRKSVPVKTRKRFRAHQSIHRAITLHPSRGVHAELFASNSLSVFPRQDGDLPRSATFKLAGTFINAVGFFRESHGCPHCGHSHFWHPWHEKRHADVCTRDWHAAGIREFHSKDIAPFVRRLRSGIVTRISL